jgi:hypothetical protein
MLVPCAVADLKVVFLYQHLPAGMLTGEILCSHQPCQGLMVGNQFEFGTMKMCAK